MKKIIKNTILKILKLKAQKTLKNTKNVIGITGSVGKTTTRFVTEFLLSKKYKTRTSRQNFNTEFGLIFSILGINSPIKNKLDLVINIFKSIFSYQNKKIDFLILEYGVDKKNDMDKLLEICKPDISIITPVAKAHIEKDKFQSIQEIRDEKLKLALNTKHNVIMNGFDEKTCKQALKKIKDKITIFGYENNCEVKNENFYDIQHVKQNENAIKFHIKDIPFNIQAIGVFNIEIFIPAIIVALKSKISPLEIQEKIIKFRFPKGRGRILKGIKNSTIWDHSYNASPKAMEAVIESINFLPKNKRKIAIIGEMKELGSLSQQEHQNIGKKLSKTVYYIFFTGEHFKDFIQEIDKNFVKQVKYFKNSYEIQKYLLEFLQEDDFLIVKGSRGNMLEKSFEKICL